MFRLVVALSVVCLIGAASLSESENDDRIVNGKQAYLNEHPYQCSLQLSGAHFCGASILNERQCLTAAHCFNKLSPAHIPLLQVRCGSLQRNSGGVLREVESYLKHEDYNRTTFVNDVAIIKLTSKIVYSNRMSPVKLASETPDEGTPCRVSGWGRLTEDNPNKPIMLQTTNVMTLSKQTCSSPKYSFEPYVVQGSMICAIADGTDACQGDSGGPMVSYRDDTLVGIVSWGIGCAEPDHPGVYSDVAQLKPWIERNSKMLG